MKRKRLSGKSVAVFCFSCSFSLRGESPIKWFASQNAPMHILCYNLQASYNSQAFRFSAFRHEKDSSAAQILSLLHEREIFTFVNTRPAMHEP
jgi:hypothetical protein